MAYSNGNMTPFLSGRGPDASLFVVLCHVLRTGLGRLGNLPPPQRQDGRADIGVGTNFISWLGQCYCNMTFPKYSSG